MMSIFAYLVIMFIMGYFLKDLLKFIIVGTVILLIMKFGWGIVPVAFNFLMGLVDVVKGAL